MRSLVPVALVLLTVLFFGSYFAGYHVPGERTLDSAQGARVIDVPHDRPGRLTNPNTTRFRRWVEFYVHVAVNEERTKHGLDPLEFDAALRDIARNHSADMGRKGYFEHVSPTGVDPGDRYRREDYHCLRGAGENIAYTYFDLRVRTDTGDVVRYRTARALARGLVTQWMHSPEHRKNILSKHWEREGIGITYTESGRVYATENFC
ncbi:SCP-like extracellular [Haladaptatus paucihalophilus DX253]|uniref:Cysteine-rich secretory protein family protein n=1 Tax=Haladaptatus paucihalophilus DX253 TaxID=797209 RepID=E7QXX5_HALPU|nr:CAP domain-containing protein [Haladaptatus paucihalophilus]EFW90676.1 SCP-like extracellular [Haladaptatus paucihalophilus DX253]SHL55735.1 Cysteine-rich secretory protein family protein [Haladaptatus paucihalophilus DX253]